MTLGLIRLTEMRVPGFSFQTGAGTNSISVTKALGPLMAEQSIVGDFACGGITALLFEMHERGFFRKLLDVPAFDQKTVHSYKHGPNHVGITPPDYANPARADAVAQQLRVVILWPLKWIVT